MAVHTIKQGLDLPIKGVPADRVENGAELTQVAIMADDYQLMKPRMNVDVGDQVQRGQLLFSDRKSEGVHFTSPVAGTIAAVNRGERRALQSVVIRLAAPSAVDAGQQVAFAGYSGAPISNMGSDDIRALLSESGLWTSLRTRPYGRVPSTTESAAAIFVTAIDTQPLAGSVETAMSGREADFKAGLEVVSKLTEGTVWLCTAAGSKIPAAEHVRTEQFAGKHPAGLVGTHIHMLDPVSRNRVAWHLGWQDVVAIGHLFTTGTLDTNRIVALAGPVVKNPRLLRTITGASVDELTAGELKPDTENRCVSGSILGGRAAHGEVLGYLGRYHNQISCLAEDRERVFLGWLGFGFNKFSTIRAFASGLFGKNRKQRSFTTTTNGSHRAMVPIGMFERVMPLDIMPTFLLRALCVDDVERAEALGCLELDEEDLSLCTFVSPGKEDFGRALRRNLDQMWKEG